MAGLALFDLDNTLGDRVGAFRRWCEHFVADHHLDTSAVTTLVAMDHDGYTSREDFFRSVRRDFRLGATTEALLAGYRSRYPSYYRGHPDALAALGRLRGAGWKLAIVTNGPATQEDKLRITGLGKAVDAVCISGMLGVAKPDRAIFEEAARRCGVALTGWMVGDDPDADIGGGRGAGLRTIWIARGRRWPKRTYRPDATARTVDEAARIIMRPVV